ncbi:MULTISPECIES: PAQR family membrane homeostasis protein TrhA [unclassified Saccharicrinis]|uniref:PAQR family membrane homeostasis protein TrhA n=1 Tax=unclassified Saccharicrinis TaxID=2646859 RepID=UPI003D34E58C
MAVSNKEYPLKTYSPLEEKINIGSHALGTVGCIVALVLMLVKIAPLNNGLYLFSVLTYGLSLITLYSASTLFHSSTTPKRRYRLNILDHCAIFLLIAGTYTPFTLIVLKGNIGLLIFGGVWFAAILGITLKFFFTGKFRLLSTIMYVLMGWMVIFAIKPLYNNMHVEGFWWLIGGGVAYTLGAVLYAIKKIAYNHAIFHLFVLLASACHFICIYFYVI